ncbi:Periplasmic trehalase precursor [compost metagenome]
MSTTGTGGGGGEYPLQDGFGWTNGVTLKMLDLVCPQANPCDKLPAQQPAANDEPAATSNQPAVTTPPAASNPPAASAPSTSQPAANDESAQTQKSVGQ